MSNAPKTRKPEKTESRTFLPHTQLGSQGVGTWETNLPVKGRAPSRGLDGLRTEQREAGKQLLMPVPRSTARSAGLKASSSRGWSQRRKNKLGKCPSPHAGPKL